jgi:hypothetical protein
METRKSISFWVWFVMAGMLSMVGSCFAEPPQPPVVDPGPTSGPPSDAIVLFDGTDLSKWDSASGGEAQWRVEDGVLTVKPGAGNIVTKEEFGDCQLRIEWAVPEDIKGEGQGRGNSGVFLQSRYEIQILDSYNNPTYPDGQAGALYKQHAPLVNASRPPGEWQTFDIIFRAPHFNEDGSVKKTGRVTVFHNGVLILNNVEIKGATTHIGTPRYTAHSPRKPLMLQDHGDLVRFRNIWVRPL